MEKAELGKRLREAREAKGYTREKLAELAGIGAMYLGEIERGVKFPSMNIFMKIIDALNVSADYILRYEVNSGKNYIFDEITEKFEGLTPRQRKTAIDILNAYIANL